MSSVKLNKFKKYMNTTFRLKCQKDYGVEAYQDVIKDLLDTLLEDLEYKLQDDSLEYYNNFDGE